MEIVLSLIEVVTYLLVRLAYRPAATTVGEPLLGRRGELSGGVAIPTMHVDHRSRQLRMGRHHLRDLVRVGDDAHVLIQRDFAQLGHQPGVVLGREERRVDAEHLGNPQQDRDGERPHVVFDLVEVARGDLELSGQSYLTHLAFRA